MVDGREGVKAEEVLRKALTSETLFSLVVRVTAAPLYWLSSHHMNEKKSYYRMLHRITF